MTATHDPEAGTWLEDTRGNRCSAEHFGSREAAQEALDSLYECYRCVNCRDCVQCYSCVRCVGCLDCTDCAGCRDCCSCTDGVDLATRKGVSRFRELDHDAPVPPVPVLDHIHLQVYQAITTHGGKLNMSDWHTCETTHCRAGWVVHLAGAAGRALEKRLGPALAAALIYRASSPVPVPLARFYDDNMPARDDIARLSQLETAQAFRDATARSSQLETVRHFLDDTETRDADVPHTVVNTPGHAGGARD